MTATSPFLRRLTIHRDLVMNALVRCRAEDRDYCRRCESKVARNKILTIAEAARLRDIVDGKAVRS